MIDKKWLSKYLAWVIMTSAWIVIIGIRLTNPDISLKTPIIISGVISIIALISLFAKKLSFGEKEKEIAKLTEEDIKQLIMIEADKRWNNIKLSKPWEWVRTKTINQDLIYAILVNLNLDDEQFIIIINASEPRISPTIMEARDENGRLIPSHIIEREMNHKARSPEGEPNIIEKELTKDEFGRPIERIKETKYAEKKEEKEESGL